MGNKTPRGTKRAHDEDDPKPQTQTQPAVVDPAALKELKPPALASIPYSIDMFEEMNHKELVLELLSDKTQKNRWMDELRISLFLAAASDPNRETCLFPFPACCIIKETKSKDFDIILKAMEEVPDLLSISEETIMDPLTWELLYWVFTNPLSLEPLTEDILNQIQEMQATTKLYLPMPDNAGTWLFHIKQTQPKPKFASAKAEHGSFYGFHGSSVRNFHSIIHRGLVCSFNRHAAYGYGTYLAPQLAISIADHYAVPGAGWAKSAFGQQIKCVAVCEVVSSPEVIHVEGFCHVCNNDDHMQLSHLYVFQTFGPDVLN